MGFGATFAPQDALAIRHSDQRSLNRLGSEPPSCGSRRSSRFLRSHTQRGCYEGPQRLPSPSRIVLRRTARRAARLGVCTTLPSRRHALMTGMEGKQ